jgi:adenine-specific DNA-methyltransferase
MARGPSRSNGGKKVETLTHDKAARKNIPTAEYQSVAERIEEQRPAEPARYKRARPLAEGETRERDEDLDPQIVWRGARIRVSKEQARQLLEKGEVEIGDAQLVWRGKDRQDWSDLVVPKPLLYVQEKIQPKAIIDDLKRRTKEASDAPDLFADFNGLHDREAVTDFYQHDLHWSNRFILGDSLSVMASLAEREALRGKVQCIYFDPPYGIKFNSNWQVSTLSRDVRDGKQQDVSREPEQIKAFRDTWKDGVHSYLTYLRDRLTVARELLTESGSIFVQIGDENVHRVRAVMDEVFGQENHVVDIVFKKKSSTSATDPINDYIIWFSKTRPLLKIRSLYQRRKEPGSGSKMTALVWRYGIVRQSSSYREDEVDVLLSEGAEWARVDYPVVSQHPSATRSKNFSFEGVERNCGPNKQWRFGVDDQMPRLAKAQRLFGGTGSAVGGIIYWNDWNQESFSNIWEDIHSENFPIYVVQTSERAIERCILMTSDPGDLILDPTCGSGTTAFVAEERFAKRGWLA